MSQARYRERSSMLNPSFNQDVGYYSNTVNGVTTTERLYVSGGYLPYEHSQCYDQTNPRTGGKYLCGGPFKVGHNNYLVSPIEYYDKTTAREVSCLIYPKIVEDIAPAGDTPPLTYGDASPYGATAWKRMTPGKPKAQLTVFTAELRELPQMLKQRVWEFRKNFPGTKGNRNPGSLYLEYQFGWAPIVRDLISMYQLTKNIETEVSKIRKNNGKWIRKAGTISVNSNSTMLHGTGSVALRAMCPAFNSRCWRSLTVDLESKYSQEIKYCGSMKYYIPEVTLNSVQWKRNLIRRMYGLTLTPADAWELMPWSWLIDYFGNVGDAVFNLTGGYLDQVVAKYAYVMSTTMTTQTQYTHIVNNMGIPFEGVTTREYKLLHRVPANPFGFGITDSQLTGSQLAILAALGLSRVAG